jgi:hypothetical protein
MGDKGNFGAGIIVVGGLILGGAVLAAVLRLHED